MAIRRYKIILVITLLLSQFIAKAQNEQFIEDYNKFAIDLYAKYLPKNKNLVFSPYLIYNNLATIWLASNGATKKEIQYLLNLNENLQNPLEQIQNLKTSAQGSNYLNVRFETFSGLVIEDSLKSKVNPDFINQTKFIYLDTILFLNLTQDPKNVAEKLNQLVSNYAIEPLPEPITQQQKLNFNGGIALISAAHFTGYWEKNFTNIYKAPFYLDQLGRKTKSIPYLTTANYFKFIYSPKYSAIEIPYENNLLSLIIILPQVDFYEFLNEFDYDKYKLITQNLSYQRIRLFLPILKIESKFDFAQIIDLNAFERGANLTNMIKKVVWVNHLFHATNFQIEEETSLRQVRYIPLEKERSFNEILFVNHPFIFIVKDNKTRAILLIGQVLKPQENE